MLDTLLHHYIFGIAGSICVFIGYAFYISDIVRWHTKPHAFSWLPWWIMALITGIIQLQNYAGWSAIITLIGWLLMMGIFLLSCKFGTREMEKIDWILLGIAIIILTFWIFTGEWLISIWLICIVDTIAFYFTWKKSYKYPYAEDALSYSIWTLGFLFSFLAVENWIPVNWLYPGFLFFTEWSFTLFLLWRRKVIKW